MQFTNFWLSGLSLAIFSVVQAAPAECCAKPFEFTTEHREAMVQGYMDLWNADFSNVNNTMMPNIEFHMDRHPTANGTEPTTVKTSQDFMNLVSWSHMEWRSLELSLVWWIGENSTVAVRWLHTGILGEKFTKVNTHAPPGTAVVYNGNDFLHLDPCTGKIAAIHLAQDMLTFFYELGVRMLPL